MDAFRLIHLPKEGKIMVTAFLVTMAIGMLSAFWQVGDKIGLEPAQMAETYSAEMPLERLAPEGGEAEITLEQLAETEQAHKVSLSQLIQDAHIHIPAHGVMALLFGVILLMTGWGRRLKIALILLLFGGAVFDFVGMYLTHFVGKGFIAITLVGGSGSGLAFTAVFLRALYEMWWLERRLEEGGVGS